MEHLEGRQSILAALQARQRRFQAILVRQGAHTEKLRDLLDLAAQLGVPVRSAPAAELDAVAHATSHGGIVAIVSPRPRMGEAELLEHVGRLMAAGTPPLLLLLEGIDDARNLGFVVRSAEALGAHALLVKKHLWDFDPAEVARPASGASERLPMVQFESTGLLSRLQRCGFGLLGCIASARHTIHDVNLTGPVVLAIGGEKRGLSGAVRSICDRLVTIPTRGEPSSLSLSHAAAIVLAEAMRQRMTPTREPGHESPPTDQPAP